MQVKNIVKDTTEALVNLSANNMQSVYFYGTCLIDVFYPRAGVCAVELLQREGVTVIYPQDQTCCGQPAWNSGYRNEALSVARAQLAMFPGPLPIVVPSASCAGMMRVHYPELFRGEPDESVARDVAGRIYELSEFLVDMLHVKLTDLGKPVSIAVHASCSAQRETGSAVKMTDLLRQLSHVEMCEPVNGSECCGFGGTFAIKQPEISSAMTLDKMEAVLATGAHRVVSQDCGCLMNIGGALEKQEHAMTYQHIAEFLWERTKG